MAAPVLVLLGLVVLRVASRPVYDAVVREDGPAEWLTFAVYAAASVVAVLVARSLRRDGDRLLSAAYPLLAAGFFVVAGEEISWGQRVFGFAGPQALVEVNRQEEANVHNLLRRRELHALYIAVGLYGAGVGRWIARRVPRLRTRWWLVAPDVRLAAYFLTAVGLYVYYDYVSPVLVALLGDEVGWQALGLGRLQEGAELSLAVGFLLFVLGARRRLRADLPARA